MARLINSLLSTHEGFLALLIIKSSYNHCQRLTGLLVQKFEFSQRSNVRNESRSDVRLSFDVRMIKDVRCFVRLFVRYWSLVRVRLVVSPCMSENKNIKFKTLNEYKESCRQSTSGTLFFTIKCSTKFLQLEFV